MPENLDTVAQHPICGLHRASGSCREGADRLAAEVVGIQGGEIGRGELRGEPVNHLHFADWIFRVFVFVRRHFAFAARLPVAVDAVKACGGDVHNEKKRVAIKAGSLRLAK